MREFLSRKGEFLSIFFPLVISLPWQQQQKNSEQEEPILVEWLEPGAQPEPEPRTTRVDQKSTRSTTI